MRLIWFLFLVHDHSGNEFQHCFVSCLGCYSLQLYFAVPSSISSFCWCLHHIFQVWSDFSVFWLFSFYMLKAVFLSCLALFLLFPLVILFICVSIPRVFLFLFFFCYSLSFPRLFDSFCTFWLVALIYPSCLLWTLVYQLENKARNIFMYRLQLYQWIFGY